jgi:hypothetical protein
MTATTTQSVGSTLATVGGSLYPDALVANSAGQLTDAQRRGFAGLDRSLRKNELGLAAILVVIAALVLTSSGQSSEAWLRPVVGVGLLIAAGAVFAHALPSRDPLARDLRQPQVLSVAGATGKHSRTTSSRGSSLTTHFLDVGDQSFEVGSSAYQALPEAGHMRVYFLSRSRRFVNAERLPDPSLPPTATASPLAALYLAKEALRGHGAERLEANASLHELGAALASENVTNASPPPPEQRDPRPLGEALIGRWSNGVITLVFGADGSLRTVLPGGNEPSGRWSVEPNGELRADLVGRTETGQAWISDDTLTITVAGEGMKFRRIDGA